MLKRLEVACCQGTSRRRGGSGDGENAGLRETSHNAPPETSWQTRRRSRCGVGTPPGSLRRGNAAPLLKCSGPWDRDQNREEDEKKRRDPNSSDGANTWRLKRTSKSGLQEVGGIHAAICPAGVNCVQIHYKLHQMCSCNLGKPPTSRQDVVGCSQEGPPYSACEVRPRIGGLLHVTPGSPSAPPASAWAGMGNAAVLRHHRGSLRLLGQDPGCVCYIPRQRSI